MKQIYNYKKNHNHVVLTANMKYMTHGINSYIIVSENLITICIALNSIIIPPEIDDKNFSFVEKKRKAYDMKAAIFYEKIATFTL